DLLVLRRREPNRQPAGPSWATTVSADQLDLDVPAGEWVGINEYFAANPTMILGRPTIGRGMYAANELLIRPTGPLEPQLAAALDTLVTDAHDRHTTFTPAPATSPDRPALRPAAG